MRVIARKTLTMFVETLTGHESQAAVKSALDAWFHETKHGQWDTPVDIKQVYATASIIDNERVVFNIKGNDYRLVTAVDYSRKTVFIKWIGSHDDYDKIDARKVQYAAQTYQK